MNILIVGNGFDLSHYLPTKYDHFMDAMNVIENKDTGGLPEDLGNRSIDEWLRLLSATFEKRGSNEDETQAITFEELFVETRDPNFLEKTKEFYKTSKIVLTQRSVLEFQYRLAKNYWYNFFKKHVQDVKTWIDFEQKIEEVLIAITDILPYLNDLNNSDKVKYDLKSKTDSENILNVRSFKILSLFDLFIQQTKTRNQIQTFFNPLFSFQQDLNNGLEISIFLDFLHSQLTDFIKIFNSYLKLVVDQLENKSQFKIEAGSWIQPNHIFSFNYTNTFRKFYDDEVKAEFLHGRFGEEQNIVLGVSDLEEESLRKLKAYGFTKYHQKLFKETDYLFLDDSSDVKQLIKVSNLSTRKVKIVIWGHSLDRSDQEYIKDIFALDSLKVNIQVIVYYFDDSAKFALLNNLLDILKKDKVEKWMKNKWLIFEKNPEVKLVETIPEQTV